MRAGLGGTVNDVVLTVITNGFRDLLDERGEAMPPDRVVRTMVPVSVRRPGEHGVYNNRVSAVFARLPVGRDDPEARLADIRAQMDGIKASKQAVAGDVLAQLSGFAPPLLLALGSRVMTRSARLNMDTATTNVPGPQTPVRALGRRLLESYPYVPVVGHDPDRRGDLLLRRPALLRRHRRSRPRSGRRRSHRGHRDRRRRARRMRGTAASAAPDPRRSAARAGPESPAVGPLPLSRVGWSVRSRCAWRGEGWG